MAFVDLHVPDTVERGRLKGVQWATGLGDDVAAGALVATLRIGRSRCEVRSPAEGQLAAKLLDVGFIVEAGARVARIDTAPDDDAGHYEDSRKERAHPSPDGRHVLEIYYAFEIPNGPPLSIIRVVERQTGAVVWKSRHRTFFFDGHRRDPWLADGRTLRLVAMAPNEPTRDVELVVVPG